MIRALIFGILHLYVDLYQSYSYDSFGVKTGPSLMVTSWNQRNKDVEFNCGENDSCERSRAVMALLFKQFFKNLLLWNPCSYFEIISQKCSLGDPFQKLVAKFQSVQKHGSGEWGLLALYGH